MVTNIEMKEAASKLVRFAARQGRLSYRDINRTLPKDATTDEIDAMLIFVNTLGLKIPEEGDG